VTKANEYIVGLRKISPAAEILRFANVRIESIVPLKKVFYSTMCWQGIQGDENYGPSILSIGLFTRCPLTRYRNVV